MKTKAYIIGIALVLGLASCSLDQEPGGSTITQKQYDAMDDKVEGAVKGIYSQLYAYGSSHDYFGKRSLDMYTDLLCGDMAMKTQRYGWFVTDERGQTYGRRSTFWTFYYDIIRLCNKGINGVEDVWTPVLESATVSDDDYAYGMYYAELLTLRGWAYSSLMQVFCKGADVDINTELAFPIYTDADTETDTILGAPRATMTDVYLRIEEDLQQAIAYFVAYSGVTRSNKLRTNVDVARLILAYSYLNKGDYSAALYYVKDFLECTSATMLPNSEVLTNGFNNVDTKSWIWGEDVTVENTTSLASFFGQCDIYSYSYASAGDVKGIDENLYNEILAQGWDIRKYWWNNYYNANGVYQWAPDGKFYSSKSTSISGDRDWLSDNVFMRYELAYLIGAEAAYRNNDLTMAYDYITKLTDERVIDTQEAKDAYDAYKATLVNNASNLATAILYNWRVELWGEGYGLQTFKRWNQEVKLGTNHLRSSRTLTPSTERIFTFELPTSETRYNPYLNDDVTTLASEQ